jgi:hypothetical protein
MDKGVASIHMTAARRAGAAEVCFTICSDAVDGVGGHTGFYDNTQAVFNCVATQLAVEHTPLLVPVIF